MKAFRNPSSIHAPVAAYSHQCEVKGPERILFLSGQVGLRADGTLPTDPIEQLQVSMENLAANLDAANMAIEDIVKLTIFVAGDMDAAGRRATLSAALGEHKPCMTVVNVVSLASPAYRVEVDAWAAH